MISRQVLDKGHVRLLNIAGPTRRPDQPFDADDRDPANSARLSFDARDSRPRDDDLRLNRYLWEHRHSTPFEMCLAGETRIPTFPCRGAKVKHYTIRAIADAFAAGGRQNAWVKLLRIRCVDPETGCVLRTGIRRAWMSGARDTWTMRVGRISREITATDNHPFLCPDGVYRNLGELRVGDRVCLNGVPATSEEVVNQILAMRRQRKPVTEIADAVGVDPRTVSKYVGLAGMGRGFVKRGPNRNLLPSQSLANPRSRSVKLLPRGDCAVCENPGTDVHHIDQNPYNNDLGNLIRLCAKHHKHAHTGSLLSRVVSAEISSIEYAGVRDVFDIEVDSEHHNFIADGFVVHNCQTWWELKLPIFVARQLVRHRTVSINEVSRRYVDGPVEFYEPAVWRGRAADKKQGSADAPFDQQAGAGIVVREAHQDAVTAYETLLSAGVCPEQARIVLPVSTYTKWLWSQDLRNLLHMLALRSDPHAQMETRCYADAMIEILREVLPGIMALAFPLGQVEGQPG